MCLYVGAGGVGALADVYVVQAHALLSQVHLVVLDGRSGN